MDFSNNENPKNGFDLCHINSCHSTSRSKKCTCTLSWGASDNELLIKSILVKAHFYFNCGGQRIK